MSISAVITADIVNSTFLVPGAAKKLNDRLIQVIGSYKYEFFRGDSFQVFIKDPQQALKIVLQIRGEARKFSLIHDIRSSIGIGEVNPYLKKLSTSTDEAFVLSGRAFDKLAKSEKRLAIISHDEKANHGFSVIASYVDYILRTLTEKQSEVLVELFKSDTQLEVAKKLKKSQSTIHKHAQSTGWHQIVGLLDDYSSLVSTITA
jgi:hypothetical protein